MERFNELVATIRVAWKIGFAHPGDDRVSLNLVGINGSKGQKQNIAPRYKRAGNAAGVRIVIRHRNTVTRQAADRQFVQQTDIQNFMGAGAEFMRQILRNINFRTMALAVIESDAMHLVILIQRLNQAGGGVLSTAKNHNGTFHRQPFFRLFILRLW